MGYADIPHTDLRANMLGEHIHAGPTSQKVEDHLGRHRSRIGADPFSGDAVVSYKGTDDLSANGWLKTPGHRHISSGQLFQTTKTAERLRQPIQAGSGRAFQRLINAWDLPDG